MERLPGLLGGEPVYWIEHVTDLGNGRHRTELGFSDVAAHPYEGLVAGTVALLRRTPGVEDVAHVDREVVEVVTRGVSVDVLGNLVDRFWFEHLPRHPVDPGFELDPADVLASPWPSAPPLPRGAVPVPVAERTPSLRDVVSLPPSRRRMWTYLVCGAVLLVGGVTAAVLPGGANGLLPLAAGTVNTVVGARIAIARRRGAAQRAD